MQPQPHAVQERIPSLDELMAMPHKERSSWLRRAAELAEPYYRNNPELTETADAIDLYDYPDPEAE